MAPAHDESGRTPFSRIAAIEDSLREPLAKRWSFRALRSRFPRPLTLFVVFVVACLIALANLTSDSIADFPSDIGANSYGWPLIWHRYVFLLFGGVTVGWYYSPIRLAANLVIWLLLIAAPGGACEWLSRRYRPRPRWSLRTMLVAVAASAALCAWFVVARDRANLQDSLVHELSPVRMERWGPKWLDFIGADRFRRHIISGEVSVGTSGGGQEKLEWLLPALGRLPRLRYLEVFFERKHLHPGLPAALAKTPQLRALSISLNALTDNDSDRRIWHECLVAIAQMTRLEHLHLHGMAFKGESLALLAGLAHLKRLVLSGSTIDEQNAETPLLAHLPPLPRLESIYLTSSRISDRDLPYIIALRGLKTLRLAGTSVTDAGVRQLTRLPLLKELRLDVHVTDTSLRQLTRLPLLEELTIYLDSVSPAGLESLARLKRLQRLHIDRNVVRGDEALAIDGDPPIYVPEADLDGFRRALEALRRSNPGIVIDGRTYPISESRLGSEAQIATSGEDASPEDRGRSISLPRNPAPWMTPAQKSSFEASGGWARFDAARWNDETVCF